MDLHLTRTEAEILRHRLNILLDKSGEKLLTMTVHLPGPLDDREKEINISRSAKEIYEKYLQKRKEGTGIFTLDVTKEIHRLLSDDEKRVEVTVRSVIHSVFRALAEMDSDLYYEVSPTIWEKEGMFYLIEFTFRLRR